jgi:hypothetical protein
VSHSSDIATGLSGWSIQPFMHVAAVKSGRRSPLRSALTLLFW